MKAYTVSPPDRCIKVLEMPRRIAWDIDRDVIRNREFDFAKPFLPAGLSLVDEMPFLSPDDARLLSQVQGRTYANLFGFVERFIGTKLLELSRDHALGDQTTLETLLRFTDEELKHQALFRRIDRMLGAAMPPGYRLVAEPNAVAAAVPGKSAWAVLALICHIELFTQSHYRASIEHDDALCPLWKDVFLHHWLEESQHAVLDELEWQREDARLDAAQRDVGVGHLIEFVRAVDGILHGQAAADAQWFIAIASAAFTPVQAQRVEATVLQAYRWQYIVSGLVEPRFHEMLSAMVGAWQMQRIQLALGALMDAMPACESERKQP